MRAMCWGLHEGEQAYDRKIWPVLRRLLAKVKCRWLRLPPHIDLAEIDAAASALKSRRPVVYRVERLAAALDGCPYAVHREESGDAVPLPGDFLVRIDTGTTTYETAVAMLRRFAGASLPVARDGAVRVVFGAAVSDARRRAAHLADVIEACGLDVNEHEGRWHGFTVVDKGSGRRAEIGWTW